MMPHLLTPEARLLLLSAGGRQNDAEIARLARSTIDWRRVIALAEIERALPVLERRLREALGGRLPQDVERTIWQHSQVASFRMTRLATQLDETLARFADEGVELLLLKGAAAVATVYGTLEERPMADLDVLIHPADAARAVEIAGRAGWRAPASERGRGRGRAGGSAYDRHQHLEPMTDVAGAGFALELHTELLLPGHSFGLTAEHVRSRQVERELGGRRVFVPHPIDQLLHSCVHFAWGHMMRSGAWRTFRDVGALIERGGARWDDVIEQARRNRAGSCCFWTLRLGHTTAALDVPAEVLERLSPSRHGAVTRVLERHALSQILPSEARCPSVRLERWLWTRAIGPDSSGHSELRPWTHAANWEADGAGAGIEQRRTASRANGKLRAWVRYVGVMLGGKAAGAAE